MAGNSNLILAQDTISPHLQRANPRAQAYLSRTTEYMALQIEGYARQNAIWHDRTGNARASLTGFPDVSQASAGRWSITLYGGMPYSIWLEVRFGGKFGIIRPTVNVEAPIYFDLASKVMDSMFG